MHSFAFLEGALGERCASGAVPLLALRIPEFERHAWRRGTRAARRLERTVTRAFAGAARAVLRSGDLTAHDAGSDRYAIALTAPGRSTAPPSPLDCRSVLERIAGAVAQCAPVAPHSGWTAVRELGTSGIGTHLDAALERGERERERYEFFSAIGHELRTPLTSIRGYLETLMHDELDAVTAARFLQTAHREAGRMARLVEGMFEFSLLDLSASALLGRRCDVAAQLRVAVETVRPMAQTRDIDVQCGVRAGVHALLDGDACVQLLVNLLENAIKYGKRGGRVAVDAVQSGSIVTICVDDDGPGVAPGERDAIFGLRFRGAAANERPGTGIGLAIVRLIAERAGGGACVLDSPLGGARFCVRLPARADLHTPPS